MRTPPRLPRVTIADGSLEALKWLALVLMALDHTNKHLLDASYPVLFNAGRAAMPIFAVVLACNLARPGTLGRGVYPRALKRLASAGAVATIPYTALGGLGWGWWPLNIMATLFVATSAMYLLDRGGARAVLAATLAVALGGLLVEFWWPALAIALGAWHYFRRPAWPALLLFAGGLSALTLVNGNAWAFLAVPVIFAASRVDLPVPRMRWTFYVIYPLHLAVLWLMTAAAR